MVLNSVDAWRLIAEQSDLLVYMCTQSMVEECYLFVLCVCVCLCVSN